MSDIFLQVAAGCLTTVVTKRLRVLVSASILLIAVLVFTPMVKAQQPLIWGYVHFPPFTSQDDNGRAQGFLADITTDVLKRAEIPYSAIELPNRRAKALINSGEIHFGLFTKSFIQEPREFVTSDFAISQIELRAFWTGQTDPVRDKRDLIGKKLILMTAYTYGGLRKFFENPANDITIIANVEQHHRAFQALKVGRGDYLLDYRGPSLRALNNMNVPDIKFSTLSTIDIYFVMHKSYPQAQNTINKMQQKFIALYGHDKIRMNEDN